MGFSHGDHVTILAAFLNACKADLDSFPLSYATSYRKRKEIVEEIYDNTREKFRSDCEEHNWPLTLHIDTKELTDTLGPHGSKVKRKKERLCVVLTTPYRAGEHTVCAPGLDSISGRVQAEAAIAGIQRLEL